MRQQNFTQPGGPRTETTPGLNTSVETLGTGYAGLGNIGAAGGDPLKGPTIAPALQAAGYRTAYFGKWHLGDQPEAVAGWDEQCGVIGPKLQDDPRTVGLAVDFLERQHDLSQPWALFISLNQPHDICRFRKQTDPCPGNDLPLPGNWHDHDFDSVPAVHRQFMREDRGCYLADSKDPAEWRRYRNIYREKVRFYDESLGKILEGLRRCGAENQTLVVATSDHGDMDGQHRMVLKGPFCYEALVHVPLLIRLPGQTQGREIDFLTSNIDLAPTLADFASASLPPVDGLSLRPLLTGEGSPPTREFVIALYYSKQQWVNPIRMIRTKRYTAFLFKWLHQARA